MKYRLLKILFILTFVCITINPGNAITLASKVSDVNYEQEEGIRIQIPGLKTENANLLFDYQQTKSDNRIHHTIKVIPSSEDTTIKIPFEINKGEYLKLYRNAEGQVGNVGIIYDKNDKSVGIFSVSIVNREYSGDLTTNIDGNILKLNVESPDYTEPYEIELRTEMTTYSTYFNSSTWIDRGGDHPISLSLDHTNYFYEGPTQWDSAVRALDAWDKVKAIHSGDSNWSNEGGLEDQFICHVQYAANKNPWNIEPSRPDVGLTATVLSLCNPS